MNAIETRIPYQLGYHGAKLTPYMGKNSITWICKDIYGKEERFNYKNRLEVEVEPIPPKNK